MWLPPIKVLCAAWIMTALATCTSHPAPVQQPATPPGLPGAGTADVSQAPTGNVAHLAAVRLAGQDGFDRLVLEFADRVPGPEVGRSQRLRGIAHPFGSVPRTCQDRHEQDGQGDTDRTCRLR
ncbi:MAG: hypothetical protein ABWY93_15040 [Mycobacterium sp.]